MKVQVLSPDETSKVLAQLRGLERKTLNPKIVLGCGFEIKGSFEMFARDSKSGEVEWQHAGDNLITDSGRRWWMYNRFYAYMVIGFCPSKETPMVGRSSLSTDVNQTFSNANLAPSNNSVTNTKTISTTFGTPGSNRTLGSIWLATQNTQQDANIGPISMVSCALLTPPKVQTTTQTLEVIYKFTMNPIY